LFIEDGVFNIPKDEYGFRRTEKRDLQLTPATERRSVSMFVLDSALARAEDMLAPPPAPSVQGPPVPHVET
jgi:hypothetical protein